MEPMCLFIAVGALLYALYVHRQSDRCIEENNILRRSLHMVADGEATIYKTNGVLRIEEKV